MRIALIVAMGRNRVIGVDGDLPWRLPDDLKHFRELTMGKPLIVGRKTYESIGGPLPGRFMIVLTRQEEYAAPGCVVVRTPQEALDVAGEAEEVVIGGGAAIYALYLPLAERIYLTEVAAEPAGDTVFPELDPEAWREVSRESHPADQRHAHAFDFVTLERR
jgi:dihydrofolate reductase